MKGRMHYPGSAEKRAFNMIQAAAINAWYAASGRPSPNARVDETTHDLISDMGSATGCREPELAKVANAAAGDSWKPAFDKIMVAVIPHTAAVTSLGEATAGQEIHVEVDILAKYVERLLEGRTS